MLIRSLVHILLTILLLVSTTGFAVKEHYCLGMLRYTTLAIFDSPCCPPEEEMPMDCCQDVITHYQLDVDFVQATSLDWQAMDVGQLLPPPLVIIPDIVLRDFPLAYSHYKPPLLAFDIPTEVQSFLL